MASNSQTDNFLESETLTLEVARKLLVFQQQQIQSQQQQIEQLKVEVAKLQGKNPTSRLDESYSLSAEEKRKERQQRDAEKKKKKKKRKDRKNLRMKTADKSNSPCELKRSIPPHANLQTAASPMTASHGDSKTARPP